MRATRLSDAFKRDLKRVGRRYDVGELDRITEMLRTGASLPDSCRPHPLKGKWKTYSECRIGPDWLLVYQVTDDDVLLVRTGTHSDLFGD